jgi:glycosyltransferase involved in cell wall biosynthesis
MKLEICIHCYNYQRRLCWMLSSILQQKGDIPNITISISYTSNNGKPMTEELIELFRDKGLNIIDVVVAEDNVKNRSLSRNIRASETIADWIIFADADMVYHPLFFADIKEQLLSDKYKNETKVIGGDRHSLDINFCENYFIKDKKHYPRIVTNVYDVVSKWPIKYIGGKRIAAGYFQLANTKAIKQAGDCYSHNTKDNIHFRKYRADRGFRVRMGGRVPMEVKPQYHLNHSRSGPELQR